MFKKSFQKKHYPTIITILSIALLAFSFNAFQVHQTVSGLRKEILTLRNENNTLIEEKNNRSMYQTLFQYSQRLGNDSITKHAVNFWANRDDEISYFEDKVTSLPLVLFANEPDVKHTDMIVTKSTSNYSATVTISVTNNSATPVTIDTKEFFLYDSKQNSLAYDSVFASDSTLSNTGSLITVNPNSKGNFTVVFGSNSFLSETEDFTLRYQNATWKTL